ncbi:MULTISPECIES: glycosyltransferase family 1 protein [unclassified Pseudomonas]|uniref:glycosyltransferase family 4 protein n=1 Tax=unclassified Pseudomonas TaxID=196821 RepID=UPI002AC8BE66|nr:MULTISPECIES: glycosyltransferase family 1 protein [unclassified Pseudomonas]MEB0042410.1 glycosyltransferase family 1 protein [Pseudomonas sp. MH10]MEB0079169.1 glycosyltransferase family 1 protein [Pseudomonas sp. MH10out]MEB0092387.1 glycosyltransferase family 1 protein [Pseudomonas sp. CCI4.2]MEB0102114.1 glycosyltransferase family 1 protein [Pseudomonas sp. CCI3.2]MEB0122099.1 glycosyltransferase family 1 protein [Pseudomonas sp. CCI1.2]
MIVINARFLTQELRGVQRFAEQTCLALKQIRNDLVFVAPHGIKMHESARALDVQCIGRNSGHLWEQLDLPLYLRRQGNPLLVSLCSTAPLFYSNQIATHHDITYVRHPESYTRTFRTLYRVMTPILLSRIKALLTVSSFSKGEISQFYNYPENKIFVVPNAVSDAFQPGPPLGNKHDYLLAVSSPSAHKNFKRMIEAFLTLRDHGALQLHIVGAASEIFSDPSLQRLACSDPRIRFLGRLSDAELIAQYQGATAFIFPSLYEGFGIPPLEAQACGCPVIAANAASIPEVLQASALYFDPLDVEHIAAAMERILTDLPLRQSLRRRGLNNVGRFSWEESAQRVSQRIDTLIDEARQAKTKPLAAQDVVGEKFPAESSSGKP